MFSTLCQIISEGIKNYSVINKENEWIPVLNSFLRILFYSLLGYFQRIDIFFFIEQWIYVIIL